MTNNNLPNPQEVLDKFLIRDRIAVDEVKGSHFGSSIEGRLGFTEARCKDTAEMIVYILNYLSNKHEH